MTAWTCAVAILSMAPGILLTGSAVHLHRRRRIPASGLAVVATVAALSIASGVAGLTSAPRWVPLALVLSTVPIGYGYATVMTRRHLYRPAARR